MKRTRLKEKQVIRKLKDFDQLIAKGVIRLGSLSCHSAHAADLPAMEAGVRRDTGRRSTAVESAGEADTPRPCRGLLSPARRSRAIQTMSSMDRD